MDIMFRSKQAFKGAVWLDNIALIHRGIVKWRTVDLAAMDVTFFILNSHVPNRPDSVRWRHFSRAKHDG